MERVELKHVWKNIGLKILCQCLSSRYLIKTRQLAQLEQMKKCWRHLSGKLALKVQQTCLAWPDSADAAVVMRNKNKGI